VTREVVLVVNPASGGGKGRRLAPRVLRGLRDGGWVVRAYESRDMDHVEELAAAQRPDQVVAVLGGDGTLGRAAAGTFHSGALLAPLPGGRGNDFCRVLGVPRDPVAAAKSLADANERRVDAGMAGARLFVCVAHAGFDSVANDIANRTPVLRGTPVYLYAALRTVVGWTPATFTVDVGEGPREYPGWTVAVGNAGRYGGGMRITPNASIDDGILDVTIAGDITRAEFLQLLPRVFNGSHVDHPKVTSLVGREIEIAASRPFDVYADGELVGPLPMTIRSMPNALRVLGGR